MSHKANDTYNEYMHENNICPKCLEKLTLELKDDGTTQGEYEIEKGHKESCEYYNVEVGGREKVDRDIKSFDIKKALTPKNTSDWEEIEPLRSMFSDGSVSYTTRLRNKKTGEIKKGI